MEPKICESCGMPMNKKSDFGGRNKENKYCKFCTFPCGTLKSYEEKVIDTRNLIMRTNDIGEDQATKMARESMRKFPAWKDISI